MNDIEVKVKENIKKVLNLEINVDELECENLIENFGINSVDALEILIHIENEFDIEIDEEDLNVELLDSVSSLVGYVEKKLEEHI